MCSIFGFLGMEDKALLKRMGSVSEHRGPDQSGTYIDKNICLGHKRLSIIDLSVKGKQPMLNEDGSLVTVYNGEVYNFEELKKRLEEKGHKFISKTDSETVLHAYEEFNESCLRYFNGMFGLAIWDSNKQKLFLAVDRIGIKPIYYIKIKDKFLFASEIKSLLQYEEVKREVKEKALTKYLTFRYTPDNETLFKGIKKLEPGHYLIYDAKTKTIKIKKYWDILNIEPKNYSESYYKKMTLRLLKDAVKKRLISDVPLGTHLSGGLDSSAIVALMSELNKDVETFTVEFEDEGFYNESKYAKIVADYFSTNHHPLKVKADAAETLPKAIWHLDEPISDPTIIAQYLISQLTKKHVTVILNGEGGDEVFSGYMMYKVMQKAEKYKNLLPKAVKTFIPKIINKTPNKILDKFFKYSSEFGEKGKERFKEYMQSLDNREKSYLLLQNIFDKNEKIELYRKKLMGIEDKNETEKEFKKYFENITKKNYLNKITYMDIKTRLPYYLLHKVDKMSMAHAIEARVPFLDHRLVEFSFKIPAKYKIKQGGKYILKKAFKDRLPKEIINREKQPFLVPLNKWYEEKLKEIAPQIFEQSEVFKKYFDIKAIRDIAEKYEKSKFYYGRQIWALLSFALWHKMYIERDNLKKPNLKINSFY